MAMDQNISMTWTPPNANHGQMVLFFFVYLQNWVIIYEVNVGKQKPAPASYLVDRCSSPVSSSDFFGPISDQNDDWFNGHIRQTWPIYRWFTY